MRDVVSLLTVLAGLVMVVVGLALTGSPWALAVGGVLVVLLGAAVDDRRVRRRP